MTYQVFVWTEYWRAWEWKWTYTKEVDAVEEQQYYEYDLGIPAKIVKKG